MEVWGLGVLGLTREEFYCSTLPEMQKRIEGYMFRVTELENLGTRRVANIILNGFNAFGGGRAISERKMWPMSLDKLFKRKPVPKSEELVTKEWKLIKQFWPDAKYRH